MEHRCGMADNVLRQRQIGLSVPRLIHVIVELISRSKLLFKCSHGLRNETARAVKLGEPWKREIVGEKLARRKRRCSAIGRYGCDERSQRCSLDDASAKTDGTDRYRQMKCTAAPGSGSALRDSNGWLPPVAKHGRLQRLQRLHHRYQKKQDPTRLKCKLTVKFIARHVSSDRVSGKHDCPANRNSHTEISRNRAETKGGGKEEKEKEEEEEEEEAVPLRSLSRKLAKEDGESFHLRAASEVGANGGLKSFAIERRRNHSSLSSQGVAGSRPAEEQPVDLTRLPKIRRNYFKVAPILFKKCLKFLAY
ncbi:hypothetical protein G5I_07007 [Acromyrmex echinatior]|uniref:Uncharacterized protein n=1 Tax=Acromyrmex echinatior TaxID=103372 RepID=F4WMM4_ACREC|nr:hypothetical protein G5I_07007 [Acromyrmex echinatior]